MSGLQDISLNDKILFIESLLIPAFNPRNKLDTYEKREEWLQTRGVEKKWNQEVLTELIERYGTVNSLEEAERKAERLLEKAEENERKLVAADQDAVPQPSCSSRLAYSVYILVLRSPDGVIHLLSTAFAVTTPSRTVAVTCAHCIWTTDEEGLERRSEGDLLLVSRVFRNADGTFAVASEKSDECFQMQPIHHNSCDVCLLQIDSACSSNTSIAFKDTIPVCPSHLMPTSARQEYYVKVYQAPMTAFAALDMPCLDIDVGQWVKVAMAQDRYFYAQSVSGPGSSGGPVVNQLGYAVGIVQDGYLPTLTVDLLPHAADVDSASQWSGVVSNGGQIAHYTKIIKIDFAGHLSYANLIARA